MSKSRYPIEDLVMVRSLRETAASRAAALARQKLERAREAVAGARRAFEEFKVYRVQEEQRSFERILRKDVPLEKLEEQKQEVRALRERQDDLEQAIFDAEKHVDECEAELRQRLAEHRQAQRDLEKLEEHREIWKSEQALLLAKKEEDEMDDFRAPVKSDLE